MMGYVYNGQYDLSMCPEKVEYSHMTILMGLMMINCQIWETLFLVEPTDKNEDMRYFIVIYRV